MVLPPFREPRLELGPVLSRRPQYLATSQRHAFAGREALETEEPTGPPLVEVAAPAPDHWHAAQTPTRTLQEGLSLVAADRGVTSLCHPATRYGPRAPESALGLVGTVRGRTRGSVPSPERWPTTRPGSAAERRTARVVRGLG